MSVADHLLFEIGCEELPPKSLRKLSESLRDNLLHDLNSANLQFSSAKIFATPRRLAVLVEDLISSQPDTIIQRKGPSVQAAFDCDGTARKAAKGFAFSCGVTVDQLGRLKTDKGEWLVYEQKVEGKKTEALLPRMINDCIQNLPIAKRMRWGSSLTEFARPVHWVVLLYGQKVIDCDILGKPAGRSTYGHRFHAPHQLSLDSPQDYAQTLYSQGKVIADFNQRKQRIHDAAIQAAKTVEGVVEIDDELLEEITAINEWPVPITGYFESRFLELPVEVLITTMQSNQKYFPVKHVNGGLLPYFITFSNIESSDPKSIQLGNERVIRPRLADAEFFWNQDRSQRLESRINKLDSIIFQQKLGTLADKTRRISYLAKIIAQQVHSNAHFAERAATLAKTDLLTEMVGEFAGLQGIMGRYYAAADHEPEEVAIALEEQYLPKQSGDNTPATVTGQVLAIADKLDTLCGIFSVGLLPTGDKDPYALRRATLGVLRIIIENRLELNILELINVALGQFSHDFEKPKTMRLLSDYVFERLKNYCLNRGFNADEFEAVKSVKPTSPLDFMRRIDAVNTFKQLPEAESLAAANKRIINILKKSTHVNSEHVGTLVETEELSLLEKAHAAANDIEPFLTKQAYQQALLRLAQLKPFIDDFFDHVMVNTEDEQLRASRLAMLSMLSKQFMKIADISKLQ